VIAMPIAALISLCLTVGLFILSLIFKVAGKLRLTLPVICFLLFITVLNKWAGEHQTLAFIILFALLGLTIINWIVSLVKTIRRRRENRRFEDDAAWQIRRAREMGIPLDKVQFNAQGDLLDPRTGEPVVFGESVQFKDI
jgi:pilus assembly protein TadC